MPRSEYARLSQVQPPCLTYSLQGGWIYKLHIHPGRRCLLQNHGRRDHGQPFGRVLRSTDQSAIHPVPDLKCLTFIFLATLVSVTTGHGEAQGPCFHPVTASLERGWFVPPVVLEHHASLDSCSKPAASAMTPGI